MTLSIAYITCRQEPHIEWFFDSLWRECGGDLSGLKIIIVDFHAEEPGRDLQIQSTAGMIPLMHVPSKPSVWQGKHRLTRENWWAAASARNTAICLAPDGWISFIDDRSVLLPGWLSYVREAQAGGYGVFGAYEKGFNLVVKDGMVVSYIFNPQGQDHRILQSPVPRASKCSGQWGFGCNLTIPLEWALSVNGFDEDADGMSFEDVIFGLMLEKRGHALCYDPRMKVLQDRTPSQLEPPFRRTDKGVSPNDKSHALLNMVLHGGRSTAPNYFGEGGIRKLRERVLAGEPFPIVQCPEADWYDGQLIKDMV